MGGFAANQAKKTLGGAAPSVVGDGCDLQFHTDLVGIRAEVSVLLRPGETLYVRLLPQGSARSVICATEAGGIVGTLAAFRGLANLIACMEIGVQYVALVETASATRCSVFVIRQ
jgi:hypothetical protein